MIKTPKYSIICTISASLLIGIWVVFPAAPTIIKFAYAILMYAGLILLPFGEMRKNDYGLFANIVLLLLVLDSLLLVCMSVYNTDPDMYEHGNKWITLFLNEYTFFSLIPPFFAYLAYSYENLIIVAKSMIIYMILALLMAPITLTNVAFLPVFFIVFFPFINNRYRILTIIATILSILLALKDSRMLLIVNFFSLASIFIVYVLKNRFWLLAFSCICVVIPFVVFTPILGLAKGELSFFQTILQFMAEHNYIEDHNDTRTFLYTEMSEDISINNAWVWGKGAYSHYLSSYFAQNDGGDSPLRMLSEVPFLNMLLHGGLFYIVIYYLLLLIAIIKGIFWGKNNFVKMASLLLSGWFLNTFIGDLTGCRFYHLGFFFLLGCCLSKKILSYTDLEIQLIIDEKFKKYKQIKTLLLLKVFHSKLNSTQILEKYK